MVLKSENILFRRAGWLVTNKKRSTFWFDFKGDGRAEHILMYKVKSISDNLMPLGGG